MMKEHERVVLVEAVPSAGLEPGDVGAVIHIYAGNAAYEIEFVALDGTTAAVVTLEAAKVRAVRPREITHARQVSAA